MTDFNSIFTAVDMVKHRIEEKRCREKFFYFFKYSWPIIEPARELIWSWHIGAITEHLQAVTERKILKLIITIPPGFAKSISTAVMWHPWEWVDNPYRRFLFGSYAETLVYRDANRAKDIINSDWYQSRFNPKWKIRKDQNSVGYYVNTAQGARKSYYVGGRETTGWRGDTICLDDPISSQDRYDILVKNKAWDLYSRTMQSRGNDFKNLAFVLMGQRLAADDITGRLLDLPDNAGYTHLFLPMEHDPDKKAKTSVQIKAESLFPPSNIEEQEQILDLKPIEFEDIRNEQGEILFPQMYTPEILNDLKIIMGEEDYQAQYNGNPSNLGNDLFDSDNFYFWDYATDYDHLRSPIVYLNRKQGFRELVRLDQCWTFCSTDFAISEKLRANFTVVLIWAVTYKFDMILLDMPIYDRITEPSFIEKAVSLQLMKNYAGGYHSFWVCETNGVNKAFIQNMKTRGITVLPITMSKDKFARATTASIRVKSGQVYFPRRDVAKWYNTFEKQLVNYPKYSQDDIVDALSIGCNGIFQSDIETIKQAMSIGNYKPDKIQTEPTKIIEERLKAIAKYKRIIQGSKV